MDATTDLVSLLDAPTWDVQTIGQISKAAFASNKHLDQFKSWVRRKADDGSEPLKAGVGLCLLGQPSEALGYLRKANDAKAGTYFMGVAHRQVGDYETALSEFQQASTRGWDELDAAIQQAETLRQAGRVADAEKLLKKLASSAGRSADYHYQRGMLYEASADYDQACQAYEGAMELDARHAGANFRLGYLYGLDGDNEQAVTHYRRCVENSPAPVNALINLAVLLEDQGAYDQAIRCLQEVLNIDPNHQRARLYMKDCLAGLTQYYDEIQEKARDKRTAVLEIPITDFELSVRSRNCLKKMNIHTLGDLLTVREDDLLSYKNFGETSLNEIKAVLAQKGLRLGQALEDNEEEDAARRGALAAMSGGQTDLLNRSVDELELSIRSRRCLERLGVRTLGDLASRSEAELMATRNFGITSLTEIKQQLAARGLSLRRLDE